MHGGGHLRHLVTPTPQPSLLRTNRHDKILSWADKGVDAQLRRQDDDMIPGWADMCWDAQLGVHILITLASH